jgi:RNA polymerase sigma-70 factor (ECF subfamily)
MSGAVGPAGDAPTGGRRRYRRRVAGSATLLLARLGDRAGSLAAGPELDRVVAALVSRAEARLPHHPVDPSAFVARIAEALAVGDEPVDLAAVAAVAAEDLSLACALERGDPDAAALAEAELVPVIRRAAAKVDATAAFVDEVVQAVRTRLVVGDPDGRPLIASYRGTGPLAGWVRVVATRAALDAKRKGARHVDDADALDRIPAPDDPELALIWQTCADEYKQALTAAFAALSRRDRALLKQRYLDGLDIKSLGRLYKVDPSTAFRWVQQIEARLGAAAREALMAKLRLTESQVKSMERMVASQLQLSLPRLLRGGRNRG